MNLVRIINVFNSTQGEIGSKMKVINYIKLTDMIMSMIVYEMADVIYISALTIPIISKRMYSNTFLRITLRNSTPVLMTTSALPTGYTNLLQLNKNNFDQYVGIPFKSFSFDVLEITRASPYDDFKIVVLHSHLTPHKVRFFRMKVYEEFIISWSWDGLLIVWDKESFEEISFFNAHNPYIGGAKYAGANPFRQFVYTTRKL